MVARSARGACYFYNDPNIPYYVKVNIAVGGTALMTGGTIGVMLAPEAVTVLSASGPAGRYPVRRE